MNEPFGPTTTADEVLEGQDLSGERVLVTGVSSGIGIETARALTSHGAAVVGAVRDIDKARRATDGVVTGDFRIVALDLGSLASVRACADGLIAEGGPFSLIIANAGVMATPFGRTADGFETQFGTNHLGHFLLVNRIAPLLRRGGRLVVLSSAGHGLAGVDLDDPNFDRTPYDTWIAYGRAKTANALFALEFDRRYRSRGVRAASVHPGAIHTGLARYASSEDMQHVATLMKQAKRDGVSVNAKSVAQGAATSLWAGVVAPAEEIGGRYCEDCHVAELVEGHGLRTGVRAYAQDSEIAKALWAKSEEMVGERFPAP